MPDNVLEFTSMIVSSFLGKNQTIGTDLPALIRTVHAALTDATAPSPEPAPPQSPAVTARRSVTPDALLCMECGKPFKSLKRHLSTDHDLSPEAYRAKWLLPQTYPMVAPTYSAARSVLAKSIGLGSLRGRSTEEAPTAAGSARATPEAIESSPPKERRLVPRRTTQIGASAANSKRSRAKKSAAAD